MEQELLAIFGKRTGCKPEHALASPPEPTLGTLLPGIGTRGYAGGRTIMDQETVTESWTPERSLALKVVGAARVSPDGTRAAFTVTAPVMTDDTSEFVSQAWLADIDGSNA